MTKNKKIIFVSLVVIIVDQLSKFAIKTNIAKGYFIKIIGDFLKLTYIENKGAAWSILEGKTIFLIIISLLFLLFIIRCIKNDKRITKLNVISYGFICGGIIGNLIDRILYKRVIDFIAIKLVHYNFPIFNIADSLIVIGTILFIIDMVIEGNEDGKMSEEYKKIKEKSRGKVSSN